MNDLVADLKSYQIGAHDGPPLHPPICDRAADEITRLRAINAALDLKTALAKAQGELTTSRHQLIEVIAKAICKSRTCEGGHCCQWPANRGRITCPVKSGAYDDAANAAIAALAKAIGGEG